MTQKLRSQRREGPRFESGDVPTLAARTRNSEEPRLKRAHSARLMCDLRELMERLEDARASSETCSRAAESLAFGSIEPAFVLVYSLDEERALLELEVRCGPDSVLSVGDDHVPVASPRGEFAELLARAARDGTIEVATSVPARYEGVIHPLGNKTTALLVPANAPGKPRPHAVLVVGLPGDKDPYDDELRTFLDAAGCLLAERLVHLRALEQAAQHASAPGEMKYEFLATVSHELRAPLQAILGWAKLLGDGEVDRDRLSRGVRVIERNALAQAKLIDDILDVSRIISGKVHLQLLPIDVVAAVQAAVDTVRPTAQNKNLDLSAAFGPALGGVVGDPARLQQVIGNLLTNAVKFTPKGGRIGVRVSRVPAREGFPEAVEISVTDSGEGIDPEFLPHVFERFRQADGKTSREKGGLGLGLAIVWHIVELHGGTVEAESDGRGFGATFRVRLPVRALLEEPSSERGSSYSAHPILAGTSTDGACERVQRLLGTRILVVDDEDDARELVMEVLRDHGAEMRGARSVNDALGLVDEFQPNVLVADIGMPSEDGFVLIRQLRLRETERGTPPLAALALTGYARNEDRRRALAAGYHLHVAKPVGPDALVTAIARIAR
jgi:signal transduction histidine kinase/ActR/RegA family two-component response regulator